MRCRQTNETALPLRSRNSARVAAGLASLPGAKMFRCAAFALVLTLSVLTFQRAEVFIGLKLREPAFLPKETLV